MLTLRYSVRILWETGVLGEYSPRKGVRTACEACKGGISTTQLYGGLQWDKSPKIERPCPIAHFKGFWGIEVVPFPQKSKGKKALFTQHISKKKTRGKKAAHLWALIPEMEPLNFWSFLI